MPLPQPQYTRDVPSILAKPRKEMGAAFITDPEYGVKDFATLMCVHCGMHWRYIPGSKHDRGFCLGCMGPTCGKEKCDTCLPLEKAIEEMEAKGRFVRELEKLK